ncbi:NINE protein [Flavobacterium sp. TP390]|uniref:NINE protein n=1 Tax=Flavobacterium profundi TaxID=1774945 RepID=A0A6I4IIU6_9FLAO|nr:TM2 domain-containing protein [Flavobacterium profundi]MVO09683.1 NINE protein [Flavobacterium profundi]
METTRPVEEWNQPTQPHQENKKVVAGICAILLGGLGVHKFILGYTNEGVIMLVITVLGIALSCFVIPLFGTFIICTIGLIEGIIYLTKTDEDFYQTYQVNKRSWF